MRLFVHFTAAWPWLNVLYHCWIGENNWTSVHKAIIFERTCQSFRLHCRIGETAALGGWVLYCIWFLHIYLTSLAEALSSSNLTIKPYRSRKVTSAFSPNIVLWEKVSGIPSQMWGERTHNKDSASNQETFIHVHTSYAQESHCDTHTHTLWC